MYIQWVTFYEISKFCLPDIGHLEQMCLPQEIPFRLKKFSVISMITECKTFLSMVNTLEGAAAPLIYGKKVKFTLSYLWGQTLRDRSFQL